MRCGADKSVLGVAVLAGFLCAGSVPSWASEMTDALKGKWSGSGQITLANGKSERIRCRGDFSEGRARGDWQASDSSGTLSGPATPGSLRLLLSSATGEGRLSATIGSCKQSINVTGWSENLKALSVVLRKDC